VPSVWPAGRGGREGRVRARARETPAPVDARRAENCIILIIIRTASAAVSRAGGGGAPMDQLTSGARRTDSPSSISGAICCPPVRPPSVQPPSATGGGGDSSFCRSRRRDVFIGTPQIDRCVRNWRFNVSAPHTFPASHAHCRVVRNLWI